MRFHLPSFTKEELGIIRNQSQAHVGLEFGDVLWLRALTFFGTGLRPLASMQCPRQTTDELIKRHLWFFSWSLACTLQPYKTSWRPMLADALPLSFLLPQCHQCTCTRWLQGFRWASSPWPSAGRFLMQTRHRKASSRNGTDSNVCWSHSRFLTSLRLATAGRLTTCGTWRKLVLSTTWERDPA